MVATKTNITIEQGATFEKSFTVVFPDGGAVPFEDYTARMDIRRDHEAAEADISLTTENGRIVLGSGSIVLNISATDTKELQWGGVYDLELVSPAGKVDRMLQGLVYLSKEVTRPVSG